MRRFFVLFFAVLLPLQVVWSAASAYCQHETNAVQAQHFGHHAHVHAAEVKQVANATFTADTDCGACHATGLPLMVGNVAGVDMLLPTMGVAGLPPPPLASVLARAPDRPQWLRLV